MRMTFNRNNRSAFIIRVLGISLFALAANVVCAQTRMQSVSSTHYDAVAASTTTTPRASGDKNSETTETKINALEQMLIEQAQRLDRLQETIGEQQETIRLLAAKLDNSAATTSTAQLSAQPQKP